MGQYEMDFLNSNLYDDVADAVVEITVTLGLYTQGSRGISLCIPHTRRAYEWLRYGEGAQW